MTQRISIQQFKAIQEPKKAKYRNKVCTYEGMRFDSGKEKDRYAELLLLERQGFVKELKRQQRFKLEVNGVLICTYIADMTYYQDGKYVVEDVKGVVAPVFKMKAKLMKAILGIEIKIT